MIAAEATKEGIANEIIVDEFRNVITDNIIVAVALFEYVNVVVR